MGLRVSFEAARDRKWRKTAQELAKFAVWPKLNCFERNTYPNTETKTVMLCNKLETYQACHESQTKAVEDAWIMERLKKSKNMFLKILRRFFLDSITALTREKTVDNVPSTVDIVKTDTYSCF